MKGRKLLAHPAIRPMVLSKLEHRKWSPKGQEWSHWAEEPAVRFKDGGRRVKCYRERSFT